MWIISICYDVYLSLINSNYLSNFHFSAYFRWILRKINVVGFTRVELKIEYFADILMVISDFDDLKVDMS